LGEYFAKFIRASVAGAGLKYQNFLAAISRWAFLIFGLITALSQLKVASYIVNTLFTGIVAMLAIAGGLAFGLGGKEFAQELLGKIKKDIE
jgi:small-conductance mechanosensitive channel